MRKVLFNYESKYFLSFGDFHLERQLDLTWQALMVEFKEEWKDLSVNFLYEDEYEDEEIILYELKFTSNNTEFEKPNFFSMDAVILDTYYDEDEMQNEEQTTIPDEFEFDEFFLDYFYIFMLFSYFFLPFFLLELSVFVSFIFYMQNYTFLNEAADDDDEEEPFDFLDSEMDICHYEFAEFHFEEYLTFEEMFYHSGFWKNKPYLKHLNLLKLKK